MIAVGTPIRDRRFKTGYKHNNSGNPGLTAVGLLFVVGGGLLVYGATGIDNAPWNREREQIYSEPPEMIDMSAADMSIRHRKRRPRRDMTIAVDPYELLE